MSEETKDMPKVSSDMEAPKALNYIEKLVAELCPGGVEYVNLEQCVEKNYGGGTPSKSKEEYWDGSIPWASVGDLSVPGISLDTTRAKITPLGLENSSTNIVPAGSVVVAIKISPGNMKVTGIDTAINQDLRGLTLLGNISARYLTYYFKTLKFTGRGTIVKSITNSSLMHTKIPLPPVEVQNAIVEILDKFTKLEAELEAELAARRAQYEYYRKLLLEDITNRVSVERVELSEIFDISNGYTPKKSVSSYWDDGNVPWFRMEDIRRNGRVLSESLIKVHESAVKKSGLFPENSIIVATSATIGEHALIKIPFLCNQRFTALVLKEKYINKLDRKFLFYYCFVLDEWCRNNTTQSSFASVDMKGFRKFVFPVPSLTDQERIVSILDTFDALVNDISSGLPAELEARRKQYEYYRDRLLTFPRKFEPAEQAMQR